MAADRLFLLPGAIRSDPAIAEWFATVDPIRLMARPWFDRLRTSGADVCEIMHDGAPTVCLGTAAFAYVGAFARHASIGFFHGNALPDTAGLLQGSGKHMRHVRLAWGAPIDEQAVAALIDAAYHDIRARCSSA